VQSTAGHIPRFSRKGVLCAVLLLGSLAHLVLHFKAHSYRSARPSEDDYLRLAMNSEESVERFSFAADGGVTLGGC